MFSNHLHPYGFKTISLEVHLEIGLNRSALVRQSSEIAHTRIRASCFTYTGSCGFQPDYTAALRVGYRLGMHPHAGSTHFAG